MRLLLGVQRQALGLGVGGRRCEGWKAVCRANFEDAKRLPDKIRYHQTVVQAIERNARKDDANVLDKGFMFGLYTHYWSFGASSRCTRNCRNSTAIFRFLLGFRLLQITPQK